MCILSIILESLKLGVNPTNIIPHNVRNTRNYKFSEVLSNIVGNISKDDIIIVILNNNLCVIP
jgi:hypothetical protein